MKKFIKYPSNYVKASTETTPWFRTDDYQICKNLGNGEYEFIEFTGTDGQMISSSGTVNVNDYKDADGNWNEEALDIISTYYSDLGELRASVPNSSDEDQIVAECIFEQTGSFDSDSVTLSEDDAYAYLDDIISGKIEASTSIKADTDPEVQAALGREVDRLRRSDLFKGNVPKDIQDRTIENMAVYHPGLAAAFEEACRELAPKGSELYNAWYNSDFRKFIPSAYLEKYLDFDRYPLKY